MHVPNTEFLIKEEMFLMTGKIMRFKKLLLAICFLLMTMNASAMLEFHIKHNEPQTSVTEEAVSPVRPWLMSHIANRVVSFVRETVNTVSYTAYKLGGSRFDFSKGVYVLDCSTFVDHVLRKVCPLAYSNLANTTRTAKPTTKDYFQFFSGLPKNKTQYWSKVDEVKQLQPGDIVVFRKQGTKHPTKKRHRKMLAAGHVMIVMSKPILEKNAFLIRVADSAAARHSNDTRSLGANGLGIGSLLLKVNPKTGQPNAYAWNVGPYFKRDVKFAMGRPNDIS